MALLKYLAKAGIRNICFRNTYRKFIGITEERTLISGSLAGDQMNILETRRFNLFAIGIRSRGRQRNIADLILTQKNIDIKRQTLTCQFRHISHFIDGCRSQAMPR